ncbi:hypothetical protein F4677DRAFT_434143 [Hypoxylon crocopeplum]|nr:hypothetical protein F4677DRAFT_434143 [Hypoxylon crocopeplum]
MSTVDVFMSSPPGPARFGPYDMSSSPNLPCLNDIFAKSPKGSKKPLLRTGGHAAPVPNDARTMFTSAATLLREVPEIDIETEQITKSPSPKPRRSRGRKNGPTPKPTTAPVETAILIESSPKDKPWQKYKGKKRAQQDEQSTIPKCRVTKPNTKSRSKETTGAVSRHFVSAKNTTKQVEERSNTGEPIGKEEDISASGPSYSEHAMRRRIDWTPPPTKSPILLGSESDNRELLSSIHGGMKSKDIFETLQDQYGWQDATSSTTAVQPQQTDIVKKRKLIELVSTSREVEQHSREPSSVKVVKMKKKTRTITELATAPYVLPIEPELDLGGPATKDSLLNYFDSDGAVKALVEHQTAVMSQKKGKAKESKAVKPKRKKKSGTVDNPILLSPNSALKQSSNQDFVFGTSSQLIREESPTTLRDLQMAIQASNQVDSDPFAESDSQGLWRAGARDIDGDLVNLDEIEVVDDLPSLPRFRSQSQHPHEEFVDINDILKSSEVDESARAPQQNSHFFQSQAVSSAQPPKPDEQEPTESRPAAKTANSRPDYDLLNDSQLAVQIASYGFKPVKKRQAMIALLDQCWTSKNPGASTAQSNSMSTSANMGAPKRKQQTIAIEPENIPKRRGRPRKNAAAEAPSTTKTLAPKEASPKRARGRPRKEVAKVVEIADSDLDESIASSSRASSLERDRIFSSPPAVDLSLADDADMSLTLSPTDRQADLFKNITRAVTSAPRSRDPARPSWHEKMLLYDPIVLEDLAAWLNGAEGLAKTGYDGEVSPADVKKWCESKSVICLWRETLRGKERKRY